MMKRIKYKSIILKIVILITLVSFHPFNGFSSELPQLSSNSVISLIVCSSSPSPEGNFGHVAIRVQDKELKIDVVFNYGLYDREQSFFFCRILLGNLDTSLEGEPFYGFVQRYKDEGRGIKEYFLALSLQERQRLWSCLNQKLLSGDRFYKFNFISNNCSTHARDLLFEQLDLNSSLYKGLLSGYSCRDAELKEPLQNVWAHLLFNFLVGTVGDKECSIYQMAFLPNGLLQLLKSVNENERTLVAAEHDIILPAQNKKEPDQTISIIGFLLLFAVTLWISYIQYKSKRTFRFFDRVLFLFSGSLGLFLLIMMLFSENSQININFNILWAFPPNLVLAFLIRRNNGKIIKYWARISFYAIIAFGLLSWYFKQYIPLELYLFAAILLIRMYFYTGININKKLKL